MMIAKRKKRKRHQCRFMSSFTKSNVDRLLDHEDKKITRFIIIIIVSSLSISVIATVFEPSMEVLELIFKFILSLLSLIPL